MFDRYHTKAAAGCPSKSKNGKTNSKENKAESNVRKALDPFDYRIDLVSGTQIWRCTMTSKSEVKITVKEMPIAYVRHIGPYKGDAALFEGLFAKLCGWASPRGLIQVIPGTPDLFRRELSMVSPDIHQIYRYTKRNSVRALRL
jgi:hypothetical protein